MNRSEKLSQAWATPSPLSVQLIGTSATEKEALIEEIVRRVKATLGQTRPAPATQAQSSAPSTRELIALIKPLIPQVKDGETPTEAQLLKLIRPLIPQVKDGKSPTRAELLALIKELMPQSVPAVVKPTNDEIRGAAEPIIRQLMTEARKGWFGGGGGGDQVRAGSGVTITTNNIGAKVISATGGATPETPSGAVDGSNTSFTVSAEPKWIVSDGITYYDGAGYTYAALTITMDVAPSQYIRAII